MEFQDIEDGCLKTSRTAARLPGSGTGGLDAPGMSKARLVITAVTIEKRPVSEVAAATGSPGPGSTRCWPATGPKGEADWAMRPRSTSPIPMIDVHLVSETMED